MFQKLIVLLVAAALALGTTEARAQFLAVANPQTQTGQSPAVPKNVPPLRSGGAAGIREAQGTEGPLRLIVGGLIVTSIVVAILLIEDDENTPVGTGTN